MKLDKLDWNFWHNWKDIIIIAAFGLAMFLDGIRMSSGFWLDCGAFALGMAITMSILRFIHLSKRRS